MVSSRIVTELLSLEDFPRRFTLDSVSPPFDEAVHIRGEATRPTKTESQKVRLLTLDDLPVVKMEEKSEFHAKIFEK